MAKISLIFFSLFFFLTLSAASGIASDSGPSEAAPGKFSAAGDREKNLALFIDALLEKDPETQCKKILAVVAADPANAETPLKAFFAAFKKVKNRSAVVSQFNGVWKKSPLNPFLAAHGPDLNRACGTPAKERLAQLKALNSRDPADLCVSPLWSRDLTSALLRNTAECLLELQQYDTMLSLFDKWNKTPAQHRLVLYSTLGGLCYTAAARSYSSGDIKQGAALENCFKTSVAGLKKMDNLITDNDSALRVLFFYAGHRQILKDEPVRFAQAFYQRYPSAKANVWRLTAAVDCGNLKILKQAVKEINAVNPRFDAAELRFKACLNAGLFAEAEKELAGLPVKRHFELRRELYIKQKEWKKLNQLISERLSKGAPAGAVEGVVLLTVAEKLRNVSIYKRALEILKNTLNNPVVANAVGYVGAVLDQDLKQCQTLLESALSREPQNMAYLDSMAWICFKQKRYAEAEKWIRKALVAATPAAGIAVILDHAGDIAAALGKNPRTFYELALKYAPFDTECDVAEITRKLKDLK